MLPGSSTSLTALFHGCGSHLKLLECVVDGTGGRVSTTPAEDRLYRPISKKEQAHHSSAGGKSVSLLPQESRSSRKTVARLLRWGGGLFLFALAGFADSSDPIDQTALLLL
ncbi:hypothetical protein TNCV_3347871 [Trichonephila clavipes]|nr:hypothetical protein TNCV_3347871 [Trichonephila clavipes]